MVQMCYYKFTFKLDRNSLETGETEKVCIIVCFFGFFVQKGE